MSEFTDSGEISVRGIRNFLSSYIHNLNNDNVKDLFAAMQAEDFNLPNADVVGGNSQAFIEPHKLSETYGMYANKKFIGTPGDRFIAAEFIRSSARNFDENVFSVDAFREEKFPICAFNYGSFHSAGLLQVNMFEYTTDDLLGGSGLFALENYSSLAEWQTVNQSTDISYTLYNEIGLAVAVNNQNNNPGLSISIDTVPGYRYQVYFDADKFHQDCIPKIVIGTTLNGFDIMQYPLPASGGSSSFEFIASTSTTYIRISSDHTGPTPDGYSFDYLIRNLGICEMNLKYANVDLNVLASNNGYLPFPKDLNFIFSTDQYGNYMNTRLHEDIEINNLIFEEIEQAGAIFDLRASGPSSEYPEYGNILSFKCVMDTIRILYYLGNGLFAKQFFTMAYVPVHAKAVAPGGSSSISSAIMNLSAKCTSFSDYGITRNEDSTYNLVDLTGSTILNQQSKAQVFQAWQDTLDEGFFSETQFNIGDSSDWITSICSHNTDDQLGNQLNFLFMQFYYAELYNVYARSEQVLPYSLSNYVDEQGARFFQSYLQHSPLPRYITTGSSFLIQIEDSINLDESILETINQAKHTIENIIQDKLDFKLVILPWVDIAAGGTLAAARLTDYAEHGFYKSNSRELVYNSLTVEYDNQTVAGNPSMEDTRLVNEDDDGAFVATIYAGSQDVYGLSNSYLSNFQKFINIVDSNNDYVPGACYFKFVYDYDDGTPNRTFRIESIQPDASPPYMKISAPSPRQFTAYAIHPCMPCAAVGYRIPNLEEQHLYDIELKVFGIGGSNNNILTEKYMINIYEIEGDPSNPAYMDKIGTTDFKLINKERSLIADNVSVQSGSYIINGVGTNFTDQLTVGERVYVIDLDDPKEQSLFRDFADVYEHEADVVEIISDTQVRVHAYFGKTINSGKLFSRNLSKLSFQALNSSAHIIEVQYFPDGASLIRGFGQMNAGDNFFSTTDNLAGSIVENDQIILGRTLYFSSNEKYLAMPQMLTVDYLAISSWGSGDVLPAGVSIGDTRYKVYIKEDPSIILMGTGQDMVESMFLYTNSDNNFGIDKITEWGPRVYKHTPPMSYENSRVKPMSGVMYLDTVDMYNLNNIILHDNKTQFYYVVLHELWHAVGMGSFLWELYNLKSTSGYPTQYFGEYAIAAYQAIVANKLTAFGENIADYYIDTVPAQGSSAHIAEYAKIVNNKIQPSLQNELMTPLYDNKRAIISAVSIGLLEDLGWTVDYSLAESLNLLDMSLDTSTNSNPSNPRYDALQLELTKKKRKGCSCCRHIDCDESDN
jgi:hypothetical protein